jgi:hypothetical protein
MARRAERGIRAARARAERMAARGRRLEALDTSDPEALAEAMRKEGIPVDLRRGTPQQKRASRTGPPRLEGVRMVTSRDGWTILVGKSGRENDRLTFKIAAPEDFWLHARGAAGAHVVVRNPDRRATPPEGHAPGSGVARGLVQRGARGSAGGRPVDPQEARAACAGSSAGDRRGETVRDGPRATFTRARLTRSETLT